MRFRQQTVVITGAGYGIGRAIALAFGAEGARLVMGGRSRDKLEAVAAQVRERGGEALVQPTDVTSEAEVARLIAVARETQGAQGAQGAIDVLVNNSGIGGPTALARDVSDADWRQTIDVNLGGAFYAAKHASAVMIEQRRGVIINIASVAGRIGFPFRTPYAASKWGMIGLSHSLAAELGPYGIRVNAVLPGNIEGERFTNVLTKRAQAMDTTFDAVKDKATRDTPLGRLITEEEVADAVLFLASPQAAAITGQALNVDGGLRMQ